MILVFKLNKKYVIGLTQEPFDTNDDGGMEGRRDRVTLRDAIASNTPEIQIHLERLVIVLAATFCLMSGHKSHC